MSEPWEKLFQPVDARGQTATVPMRVLRRNGQPFLLLPVDSKLAAQSLALYAAQTTRARIAKAFLRMSLAMGLPAGLDRTSVSLNHDDAFSKYLSHMAGAMKDAVPAYALLAGNPRMAGQRTILLLFN